MAHELFSTPINLIYFIVLIIYLSHTRSLIYLKKFKDIVVGKAKSSGD